MLAVHQLEKSFAGQPAVRSISHRFAPEKVTALLGPSGCGKSTMLAMMAGLLDPDHGEVRWDNSSINQLKAERRAFAMVFQDHALFPHLTVLDNVAFGLKAQGVARVERRQRAAETLADMRAEQLGERRVENLSGGERQRVALARALVVRPRCLLLDEPFAALDPQLRRDLQKEFLEYIRGHPVTTVLVTHDPQEACLLGDELLIMREGRLLQSGAPADCCRRPASAHVARSLRAGALLPAHRNGDRSLVIANRHVPAEAAGAQAGWALLPRNALQTAAPGKAHLDGVCHHVWFGDDAWRALVDIDGHLIEINGHPRLRAGQPVALSVTSPEIWIMPDEPGKENEAV